MQEWRLILDPAGAPEWNMAVDTMLWLQPGDSRVIRLYTWQQPAITVGRHQRACRLPDLARCRQSGVAVIRRPTGGRAVLHGHDVTVSVAASVCAFPGDGSVLTIHRLLAGAVAQAVSVQCAGAQPVCDIPSPVPDRISCFGMSLPGDVTRGGVKLAGGAQCRRRDRVLEQISIPVRSPVRSAAALLDTPVIGQALDPERLRVDLVSALESALPARFLLSMLNAEELAAATGWLPAFTPLEDDTPCPI